MGLYDNLNKIQRAIEENQKKDELKTTKTTKNQLIKYKLNSILQEEIEQKANIEKLNIHTKHVKDLVITNVLNNIDTEYLHSKEYTTYYLIEKYDKIANKIQKQPKKQQEQTQNIKINKIQGFSKLAKILIYIFLAPFLIIGFFFIECAREASRTNGRGRRR